MKRTAQILLLIGGLLALVAAGFYGVIEAWGNFGSCLAIASILLISGLLESEYHRICRRFDDLEEFFLRTMTSIQQDKSRKDKPPDAEPREPTQEGTATNGPQGS